MDQDNSNKDQSDTLPNSCDQLTKVIEEFENPEVPRTWINESDDCQSCGS